MEKEQWQAWIIALVGLWSMGMPVALAHGAPQEVLSAAAAWSFVATGAIAFLLSLAVLTAYRAWESYVAMLLSLWLGLSPWALQFSAAPMARQNALGAGAAIFVLSAWALFTRQRA
nr:SPW repeat protein [uncultured Gellertiella sp.]